MVLRPLVALANFARAVPAVQTECLCRSVDWQMGWVALGKIPLVEFELDRVVFVLEVPFLNHITCVWFIIIGPRITGAVGGDYRVRCKRQTKSIGQVWTAKTYAPFSHLVL